ncbi:uncharacterized protein EAF01_002380 [Botrytis porri]|uniref:uncharacterized protein n=1 Tax=Botrytis porri TaxID=87229 RepID=UPI0019010AA7|nr:uncharacterized protein EAF01_002380 [Botrytis porri]KAF7910871.1 hypothetical protein EAF01_002380 [Botrytis porri]
MNIPIQSNTQILVTNLRESSSTKLLKLHEENRWSQEIQPPKFSASSILTTTPNLETLTAAPNIFNNKRWRK